MKSAAEEFGIPFILALVVWLILLSRWPLPVACLTMALFYVFWIWVGWRSWRDGSSSGPR